MEKALDQVFINTGISYDVTSRRLKEYSYDASNFRITPQIVVFPENTQDVITTLQLSRLNNLSVTTRGGGTSMAGNSIGHDVVMDLSRFMNSISAHDEESKSIWAEPGVVLSELRDYVEAHTQGAFTFAPDPSSVTRATVGGSLGNDACGNHSVRYGRITDHVIEVELITSEGAHLIAGEAGVKAFENGDTFSSEVANRINTELSQLVAANLSTFRQELQKIPRQVSGYHLGHLLPEEKFNVAKALCGSEGTCAVVVRARLKMSPKDKYKLLLCAGYATTAESARDVPLMLSAKPTAIEGLDSAIVDLMKHKRGEQSVVSLPEGNAFVLIELSSNSEKDLEKQASELSVLLGSTGRLVDLVIVRDKEQSESLWKIREDGAGLSSRRLGGVQTWPGWEDSAVAPENLADYIDDLQVLLNKYEYTTAMYGHFGAGCLHMRCNFDFGTQAGREKYASFMTEAAHLVVSHGGSLSGEHGDGRARGKLLPIMYSPGMMKAFADFKQIWDPNHLLNPGVIIDPEGIISSLALDMGEEINTNTPQVLGHSDSCIGVGRCRSTTGGFMCPSYRATKDEKDSTRGRARVLQEFARSGNISRKSLAVQDVKESLDLCLSCKACSTNCPTGVDMADAKSTFLSDYYDGKLRPFTHYTIGWLPRWLPLLSRIHTLANWGMKQNFLRKIVDALGISAKRNLPAFRSKQEINHFFNASRFQNHGDAIIFADCFTKAFRPQVISSAARVLSSTGKTLECSADECCGLTWISTGQRDAAAKKMSKLVQKLDDGSHKPIIVLEPSCAAAIKEDGPKLLKSSAADRVSKRVRSFAKAIDEALDSGWEPQVKAPSEVVLQAHCHEYSTFGIATQANVLRKWGAGKVVQSSSCCGVAGNFGFESSHFDLSMKVAEHSLIPALENADSNSPVLTDGFSCSMQLSQIDPQRIGTHLATILDG